MEPLAVDLDGTLLRTDMLPEATSRAARDRREAAGHSGKHLLINGLVFLHHNVDLEFPGSLRNSFNQ